MAEDWEKKAKETLKKAGHRGGEAVSRKVPASGKRTRKGERALLKRNDRAVRFSRY